MIVVRVRPGVGMLAVATAVAIVLFGVESTTTAVRSAADPPSIPLTVATTDIGLTLIVDLAIGGKPLKVVLDTGSTGLHVLASKVPPEAVRRTGPAPGFGYANGKRPTVWGGQFDGNMGVGMRDVEGVVNPLWRLPNGLGHAFAVHYDPSGPTTVLLGEPEAGYGLVHLDKGGPISNLGDTPPSWNPFAPPVCFTVAALPGGKTCGPTLFDTGTPAIRMVVPDADVSDVPAGTAIELSVGDGCRDAAKIAKNRRATLTRVRRVASACQSWLHRPGPEAQQPPRAADRL